MTPLNDHPEDSLIEQLTIEELTRDLPQPKLISGEVDVENIDAHMPNNGSGGA